MAVTAAAFPYRGLVLLHLPGLKVCAVNTHTALNDFTGHTHELSTFTPS